jgi:hypothetical protein
MMKKRTTTCGSRASFTYKSLVEQIKELLESSDSQITVVECLPTPDAAAKNAPDLHIASRDPNNPDATSSTERE